MTRVIAIVFAFVLSSLPVKGDEKSPQLCPSGACYCNLKSACVPCEDCSNCSYCPTKVIPLPATPGIVHSLPENTYFFCASKEAPKRERIFNSLEGAPSEIFVCPPSPTPGTSIPLQQEKK